MKDSPDELEQLPHPDLEYRRLRLFSIDMDGVRHGLRLLRRYRRNDVRFALLRDVVITYSRPFVATKSPRGGKFTFSLRYVPRGHRSMHLELVRVRNTLFAHSDLQTHQPQLLEEPPGATERPRDVVHQCRLSRPSTPGGWDRRPR